MPNTNMTYPNTIYITPLFYYPYPLSAILIYLYYLKSTRKKQRKHNNYLHLLSFNAIII